MSEDRTWMSAMPIPEELDHLVTRTVAGMPTPDMPTRVLRWENAYDLAGGLGPARQEELHAAVSALRAEGGLLFVVLPLGEVYEGGNFAAVRKVVAALAGKANLGDVEFEVLEGKLLAFELAAAPELPPLSPEVGPTSCLARDLATPPFQRASRSKDGRVHDDGLGVMTALDRELLSMNAAVRDGVRIVGTVAGVLAFHPAPHQHIPGARVVVDAATGAGYHGPMVAVVDGVSRWAGAQGFPRGAVAELVRNAWVHRDWSLEARATPILVHRNGRRLDVVTPGVLTRVGEVRNPVLQTLCRRAGLVTGHGIGIEDLRADLAEDGACSLEMCSMAGEVRARLTLARASSPAQAGPVTKNPPEVGRVASTTGSAVPAVRREVAASAAAAPVRATTGESTPVPSAPVPSATVAPAPVGPQIHVGASARDAELLRFVAHRGEVSCKLVQDELGWSRSTARDVLARLVGLGRLRRTAEDPRSPSQSYVRA